MGKKWSDNTAFPAGVPVATDYVPYLSDPGGTPANKKSLVSDLRRSAIYPEFTTPVNGDFAWINQGSATVTVNANGGICLFAPATGDSLRIRKKAAPATPYTITSAFIATGNNQSETNFGIGWRQSSDGKLVIVRMLSGNNLRITKYNSPTSGNSDYANPGWVFPLGLVWFRIADNGTNRICSISADGSNFLSVHTVGRTDFLTADEALFYVSAGSQQDAHMTLLSWKEA